jgi:hypothetical protein
MSEEEKIDLSTDDSQPALEKNVVNDELQIDNEATQPSTIINEPLNTMEVQKHPHHVMHKKKWGEYLLEFLMLFLAVFLGFVAENIREHAVENDRAKEYAVSLVQDLQNDTTAINVQVKSGNIYIAITDSLLQLSNSRLEGRNAAEFSFYTRFMYWTSPLTWNRVTFEQIKSSGSLRYFKNYKLLEKLMKYNELVNEIDGEFAANSARGNMLLNQINEIIDPGIHYEVSKYYLLDLDTMSQQTKEIFFSLNTEPLENKRKEINEMLNMTVVNQRNFRFNDSSLLRTKKVASELITEFKKEYHLENE